MKYRIHIVLSVLLVVISVFVACFFLGFTKKIMTNSALRHLDTVATLQEIRLGDLLNQYRSEVQLVQSRTNMRKKLHEYLENTDDSSLVTVENIINDARDAVPLIKNIYIYDLNQSLLVSTTTSIPSVFKHDFNLSSHEKISLLGFYTESSQEGKLALIAPLYWEEEFIANVVVEFSAESLFFLTETYVGLGETGETGIALKLNEDEFVSLSRLRHKTNDLFNVGDIHEKGGNSPIRKALLGFEEIYLGDITDYRDVNVIAATKHVDAFDMRWALVVKIDESEIYKDFERFRFMVIFTIFGGLTSFSLLIGTYMMVSQMKRPSIKKKK